MNETQFGEQQLRDCVNTSLIIHAMKHHNTVLFPHSPTPHEEKHLGWDTGFSIPGLSAGNDTVGCNLFIQYKISSHHSSEYCDYYKLWGNRDYFKFNLCYTKHGVPDYHQLDRLIDLNAKGYSAIYVTNHIWQLSELNMLYLNEQLVHDLPVLEVVPVLRQHTKVTFTDSSNCFYLHSDVSEAPSRKLISVIEQLKATSFADDVEFLMEVINRYGLDRSHIGHFERILRTYREMFLNPDIAIGLSIRYYLMHYMNLHWYRFQVIND